MRVTDADNLNDLMIKAGGRVLDTASDDDSKSTTSDTSVGLPTGDVAPTGWPKALTESALSGVAGEVVRAIDPHTEADPAAILFQFLAAFGNVVGRNPYFQVEATPHYLNSFVTLVGDTSKARKGTSWGHIDRLFRKADDTKELEGKAPWERRQVSGLSSGEGLIWEVRDAIDSGRDGVDPGVSDKRRIVIDSEFASTLKVLGRQGNNLSPVIRNAWDSGALRILTKNSPAEATGAHISIIGHITRDELKRELTSTEMGNGFANRFLWICVRRSKLLPEGGSLQDQDLKRLIEQVQNAVNFATNTGRLKMTETARKCWRDTYRELSDAKPGLLGAITARAEAQVIRLSSCYALLGHSDLVDEAHLSAGLAAWEYCDASARFLFGDATGDAVADEILDALRRAGSQGLTRTQIRDLFNRNQNKERIEAALRVLEERHLAECKIFRNGDQRTEIWHVR